MAPSKSISSFVNALPFWLSIGLIPFAWLGVFVGGWTVILLPILTWYLFSIIDAFVGLNEANADPNTSDQLFWYRLITILWAPIQFVTLFGILHFMVHSTHLGTWEKIGLAIGLGVITGTVGINYSHELMHQKSRIERWSADILLAMVLYSHFRSEHLLVHHRYVGTPKDAVTARYNEGFHRFFPQVLRQSFLSAIEAERAMLARRGDGFWHLRNPFLRYIALQLLFLALAFFIGGWEALGLFLIQSFIAIYQLEVVNYVEHYGLTRKHLGDGKYEHVQPRHSWNASHKASNWLLINLQRHSDHHFKPDRPYPLLQTYSADDAPQLPRGYPVMTMVASIPPLWRRVMNPKVREWRKKNYPEIEDWSAYSAGSNPPPR